MIESDELKTKRFDFGWAIDALKMGARVTRTGWNGKGMWLKLQTPDLMSKMTRPYIYMRTVSGDQIPWVASQADMLATDWELVPDEPDVPPGE